MVLVLLTAAALRAEARAVNTRWLTRPAEKAVLLNQFDRAAVLYNGALALQGPQPALYWRLAQIHNLAGNPGLAAQALRAYLKCAKDPKKRTLAAKELRRLTRTAQPVVPDDMRAQVKARRHALLAAGKARALVRKRRDRQAIRYYEAALVMDSSLVGVFRLLGAAYGRLKDKKRAQAFYLRYLRLRPGGRLADRVRRRLRASKALARVTFRASFASAIYINRLRLGRRKTPLKSVRLPAGTYTVVAVCRRYHFARRIRLTVKAGERRTVRFPFAVLVTRLKPWARIRANGRALGLWDKVGLPAGPYKLTFRSDDGKKQMARTVVLKGGQRLVVRRWR